MKPGSGILTDRGGDSMRFETLLTPGQEKRHILFYLRSVSRLELSNNLI